MTVYLASPSGSEPPSRYGAGSHTIAAGTPTVVLARSAAPQA
jgi:hypothetical protein